MDIVYLGGSKDLPRLSFDEIRAQVHDPEILDKLANLPDEKVRIAVASHPRVRVETLIRLLEDPTTEIPLLILLASYPQMPIEILHKLAKHKNPMVSEEAKGVLFIRSKGHIDIQDD